MIMNDCPSYDIFPKFHVGPKYCVIRYACLSKNKKVVRVVVKLPEFRFRRVIETYLYEIPN